MKSVVRDAGYWLYLLALVYAPFAYGCTRPWAAEGLRFLLLATFAAWLPGRLAGWKFPHLSWPASGLFGLLILMGWWMTWNARSVYDFEWETFIPTEPPAARLPGSVAANASLEIMGPLTAIFGAFFVAADMAWQRVWRRRLFLTMALTGVGLALFGIILKFGGPSLMELFWESDRIGATNFALYRYHGNAGAYLNLVWPLVLGFTWRAWEQIDYRVPNQLHCLGWALAACVCWAGVLINASKFGLLVFLFLLPIFLILRVRTLFQRRVGLLPWASILLYTLLALVMGAALFFFASASPLGTSVGNLEKLESGQGKYGSIDQRLMAYAAEEKMLPDAGWHGFGPGTFRVEFPYYTGFLGDKISGYWYYAHEDYLQTWIEWGWLGCVLWFFLVFGGLVRGWAFFTLHDNFHNSEERLVWLGGCLSLTGLLVNSSIDFPLQVWSLSFYALTLVAIFWNTPERKAAEAKRGRLIPR